VTCGGKLVWMMTKCWVTVVVARVSSYAKGYCWSCGLSTLHIFNPRASRHNLLSYPKNGDNRPERFQEKKVGDLSKNNTFASSFDIAFKVEVKLEISMFGGQVNTKVLNRWKQMEVSFGPYQVQEAQ
jgi:hypothetical protein